VLAQIAGRMYFDQSELQRLTNIPTAMGSRTGIIFL